MALRIPSAPGKVRYVIDGETLAGVTLGSRALSFLTRS